MSSRSLPSAQPLAIQRVAGFCEVASGVDALYLSGRCEPPAGLLADLADGKAEAQAAGEPVPFDLAGVPVVVQPRGWQMYPFVVLHPLGRIGFRPAGRVPPVRVQPLAEVLHGLGPHEVVAAFYDLVSDVVGGVEFSVSRVDVFGDFQGWTLSTAMEDRFLCRARKRGIYKDNDLCTGFVFGFGKQNTFGARLYDKTVEIDEKGNRWVRDLLWGERFDSSRPVHRLEFEIGRKGLTEMQVSSPVEVLEAVGDLWRYCTHDWLTLRTPTGDSVKSRWPLDPTWEVVQSASGIPAPLGLARVRDSLRVAQLERLVPVLFGVLSSVGAVMNRPSLRQVLDALPTLAVQYEARSGVSFADRVTSKRRKWGLQ